LAQGVIDLIIVEKDIKKTLASVELRLMKNNVAPLVRVGRSWSDEKFIVEVGLMKI